MRDEAGREPSAGANWLAADMQGVTITPGELTGVERTALRLNEVTRDFADAEPFICDPFAFGAALRQASDGS
ncbi:MULTISPECIES: hypothetical protein [unclassified Minwuia]|jgi:hypothetical protein|uniref:hypothetical protein n=1 Tax=unclassified Minwuia TaxID=2618799 RepID=UPI0024799077|nr:MULTISPECIES: hypothetical protein [unclassified Minwuia]